MLYAIELSVFKQTDKQTINKKMKTKYSVTGSILLFV